MSSTYEIGYCEGNERLTTEADITKNRYVDGDDYCKDNETLRTENANSKEISAGTLCKKCSVDKSCVLLRKKDSYCRSCFLTYVTQKFRATIGKAKAIGHGDGVLVAFSGGRSSTALAHLVANGLKQSEFKKLHVVPSLLYIDEGSLQAKEHHERKQLCREVWKYAQLCGMTLYVAAYENLSTTGADVYNIKTDADLDRMDWNPTASSDITKLIDSAKSVTAKEDVINVLRRECLALAALATDHKKVLLGDNATALAVSTLTSVATGRGDQLLECVGFQEVHGSGIEFLRCLRELDAREIAYYLQLNNQQPINVTSITTKCPSSCSINRLSESFVLGLQDNLPSTVPTIVRTAAKLSKQTQNNNICILCQRQHCNDEARYTAATATYFSERISHSASPLTRNEMLGSLGDGVKACSTNDAGVCGGCDCSSARLKTCYGCTVLMKSVDTDFLPAQMMDRAKDKAKLLHLREQIEDFLLE